MYYHKSSREAIVTSIPAPVAECTVDRSAWPESSSTSSLLLANYSPTQPIHLATFTEVYLTPIYIVGPASYQVWLLTP